MANDKTVRIDNYAEGSTPYLKGDPLDIVSIKNKTYLVNPDNRDLVELDLEGKKKKFLDWIFAEAYEITHVFKQKESARAILIKDKGLLKIITRAYNKEADKILAEMGENVGMKDSC